VPPAHWGRSARCEERTSGERPFGGTILADMSSPSVEIKVRDDGPYRVTGPVRIVDVEGNVVALPPGESVALCRCGRSATKPFCDGAHRDAEFRSRVRADGGPS